MTLGGYCLPAPGIQRMLSTCLWNDLQFGGFQGFTTAESYPPGAGMAALAQIRELAKEQKASQAPGFRERSSPRHGEQARGRD